ncbi:hypothetical protein D3C84_641700 [compost metagenome]
MNRHDHVLGAVDPFADAIDVLARAFFPFRWRVAIAAEDDAFLEVHMHRVRPTVATVDDFPHFQGAVAAETGVGRVGGQLRRGAELAWVHAVAEATVGLDGPGRLVGAVGAAEDELTVARGG